MLLYIQCKLCGVRHPVEAGKAAPSFPCKRCGRLLNVKLPLFHSPSDEFWRRKTLPVQSWAEAKAQKKPDDDWIRRFGAYMILEEIARGGMGVVFKARHVGLHKTVALKVLEGANGQDLEMAARFRKEARTAANLKHPNIIAVHDIGHMPSREPGCAKGAIAHFYAMEYIEGETLDDKMYKGTITVRDALRHVAVIARALEYIHKKGVAHRDVKPGNIIIDKAGKPFLMDFGLAKEVGARFRMTRPGMAMGTPAYMSPEQASSDNDLDGKADVYSLGAVIFEILTGHPPFRGGSLAETMAAVVSREKPSIRKYRPDIDPEIEAVCLKALEKEPAERYESAEAMAKDIESYVAGRGVSVRPRSFRERVSRRLARSKRKMIALLIPTSGAAAAMLIASGIVI